MGILLLVISIILLPTASIGVVYGTLKNLILFRFNNINKYCKDLAISIDQFGNVSNRELFNDVLITKDGYKFGNPDETISSVLGKNNRTGTFRIVGKSMDKGLDKLEKEHSIKSIEEDEQ